MNTVKVSLARGFAIAAHAGQVYESFNGAVAYTDHVFAVAEFFENFDDAEELIVGALLHDTVEDNLKISLELIRRTFGDKVAVTVDHLTRRETEVYLTEYIHRVAEDENARLIKLVDLAYNIEQCILGGATAKNASRLERYKKAQTFLLEKGRERLAALVRV